MYIQNGSLRIKAKLRRLMLSVFAVCLLVCAALLSVIAGGGVSLTANPGMRATRILAGRNMTTPPA